MQIVQGLHGLPFLLHLLDTLLYAITTLFKTFMIMTAIISGVPTHVFTIFTVDWFIVWTYLKEPAHEIMVLIT